jgi:hypothetical protein
MPDKNGTGQTSEQAAALGRLAKSFAKQFRLKARWQPPFGSQRLCLCTKAYVCGLCHRPVAQFAKKFKALTG